MKNTKRRTDMKKRKGFEEEFLFLSEEVVKFHTKYMEKINSSLPSNVDQIKQIKTYFYELAMLFRYLKETKELLNEGQALLLEFASSEDLLPKIKKLLPELKKIVDEITIQKLYND